jgi:hypothetical protein
VNYFDPSKSGIVGKLLFFVVLFFFLSGLFNLSLLFLRRKLLGGEGALATVGLSFRQANLLSLFCIGLLILQSFRMLEWWDGLIVLAGVFLIELYFLSRH